jgi:hypothetical protein
MGTVIATTGINLFMSLYGLSVFLETPEAQRKGHRRYIVISIVLTGLFSISASLDMANYFQTLFKSTSLRHWYNLLELNFHQDWKFLLGYAAVGTYVAVGDALLVRAVPDLRLSGNAHGFFVASVSLLYNLCGI